MSDENLAPGRVFEQVKSQSDREKLLKQTVEVHAATTLWSPSQKIVLQSYPTLFDGKEMHFHRPEGLLISSLDAAIGDAPKKLCLFSLSSDRANLFFRTGYFGYSATELKFFAPRELYKVQRRKHYRLAIPEHDRAHLTIDDPLFREGSRKRELHDVSAGGASFRIQSDEAPLYSKDMPLKIHITLDGQQIDCDCTVRNLINIPKKNRSTKNSPSIRVGLEFKTLAEKDRKAIASFVLKRSRKYLAKYL